MLPTVYHQLWVMLTIWIGLIGLCVGSFLNVIAYRLPIMWLNRHQSQKARFDLSYPSSHCPQCKHTIRWFHNIPVLSYVYLQGRCAYCKQKYSPRYMLVEILTALLGCSCFWLLKLHWCTLVVVLIVWTAIPFGVIVINKIQRDRK